MGRLRFVQPGTVRLELADVHRRALAALKAKTGKEKASKKALADAQDAVADAVDDGAWIEVKRELTASEQRRIFADMVRDGFSPGQRMVLDPAKVGLTKVVAYLTGWSFTDESEEPVPVSEDALDNLDGETYAEIVAAVEWHDAESDRARAERKNIKRGATALSATSASRSGLAGPSNTSAH